MLKCLPQQDLKHVSCLLRGGELWQLRRSSLLQWYWMGSQNVFIAFQENKYASPDFSDHELIPAMNMFPFHMDYDVRKQILKRKKEIKGTGFFYCLIPEVSSLGVLETCFILA